MKQVVIFGVGVFARVAHFYFCADSPHQVVAFTVHERFLTEKTFRDTIVGDHTGEGYRIGYAESQDGYIWTKMDDEAGIFAGMISGDGLGWRETRTVGKGVGT
jgi:hypothetical protein